MNKFLFILFLIFSVNFSLKASENNILVIGNPNTNVFLECAFYIEGEITKETYLNFLNQLNLKRNKKSCEKDENGVPSRSFMKLMGIANSDGGDLNAAIEIMKLVRSLNLDTWIDRSMSTHCNSSCALIYASGKNRHLSGFRQNTQFGIHKPKFTLGTYNYIQEEKRYDEIKYFLIDFFKNNNVDPRFVIKMFETQNENVFFPSIEDLLIWRVVTSLREPLSFDRLKK